MFIACKRLLLYHISFNFVILFAKILKFHSVKFRVFIRQDFVYRTLCGDDMRANAWSDTR